jgi:isochorismate synthase
MNDVSHQNRLQKPFAIFSRPGSSDMTVLGGKLLISENDSLMGEPGFLFFPFIPSKTFPKLYLQPEEVLQGSELNDFFKAACREKLFTNDEGQGLRQTNKEHYIEDIKNLIGELNSGSAEKVVISRTTVAEQISDQQIFQCYNLLCETYPDAFVYLVHFPPYGAWFGATPETLISCDDEKCQTMALAGTRKAGSQDKWGSKEKEEQAIVSRYIQDVLLKHQVQNLNISEPFARQAGVMEHLCTVFSFEISDDKTLAKLINDLHPTPAVCGIPKEKSLKLIKKYENHQREYYTGFLGPVNLNGKTDLFVNLRCIKITSKQMILFTGGGITKDSNPEKEWQETELKAQTMLAVLEKMRNLAP